MMDSTRHARGLSNITRRSKSRWKEIDLSNPKIWLVTIKYISCSIVLVKADLLKEDLKQNFEN
jgi:hypothetical protein